MTLQRPLFKIQCRLRTPAAPNLTSIQNKILKSSPLYFVQYSFIPATNSFSFPTLLWSKPRRTCPTLSTGMGNGILLNSLIPPSRLHFFSRAEIENQVKKDDSSTPGNARERRWLLCFTFRCTDADTFHIAFDVMLKTVVNFHVKYHCHC